MVPRYFVFGPAELSALRNRVPEDLGASCTRFELLTAAIWRCRTAAWGFKAGHHRARLLFNANTRRWCQRIPHGYYGNAFVYHVVDVAAGELCGSSLGRAVSLIREAKEDTREEHLMSTVDFMASTRGTKPPRMISDEAAYMVSDWTRLGEDGLDFGWAERVGGGVAMPVSIVSFHGKCSNSDGDDCVVVSMLLPEPAMVRFDEEIKACLEN